MPEEKSEGEIIRKYLDDLSRTIDAQDKNGCAANVRAIREYLHTTRAEFGRLLEAAPITVDRWEEGRYCPRRRFLKKMQVLCGIAREPESTDSVFYVEFGIHVSSAENAIELLGLLKDQIRSHPSKPTIVKARLT